MTLDYKRTAFATPNDPGFTAGDQAYLNTVRLPQAWDQIRDAPTQVIAVVDTGVDASHPELAGRLVPGYNVMQPGTPPNDYDPYTIPSGGHGTMVAGIAAANTNNNQGIAGAAWNGRIMPIKVFDTEGRAADSDTSTGVCWAADHGAKVINLSLGKDSDGPVLHAAIQYATNKGALVVAAAGNSANGVPNYPAAYPEVLAVAATDNNGALADFSTYGDWVDVAAPGFNIWSTWPTIPDPNGDIYDYGIGSGTSFAAPIVSGIAALTRAKIPTFTPAQVIARFKNTARDAGPRGIDPYYGAGIVDAARMVVGPYGPEFAQPSMGANEPNDVPARATVITSSATGTFGAEGDVDWYRLEVTAPRTVAVTVTGPTRDKTRAQNADPILEVFDPQFRSLAQVDGPKWDDPETAQLSLEAGTHYIAVRNSNGAIDSRPYTLTVGSAASAPAVTPGQQALVRDVTPPDFAGGQPVALLPSVTFAADVDPASVTEKSVRLVRGNTGEPVPAAVEYDAASKTAKLTPQAPLVDNTPFRIVVDQLLDPQGTAIPAAFTSTFRTVDTAPPVVSGFKIVPGAGGIGTLTWDPVTISDLDVQIVRMATGEVPPASPTAGTAAYQGTSSSVTTSPLAAGTTYSFRIWVRDRTGALSKPADAVLRATKITTSGLPAAINAGDQVNATAKLERVTGGAVAGEKLLLMAHAYNKPWTTVATVQTDDTGLASVAVKPDVTTEYQWQYGGGSGLQPVSAVITKLGVRAVLTSSVNPDTVPLGGAVKVSGTITPIKAGKPIEIQRLDNGKWVRLVSGTMNNSGAYLFTQGPPARGTCSYRVVIPADNDHVESISPVVQVKVT